MPKRILAQSDKKMTVLDGFRRIESKALDPQLIVAPEPTKGCAMTVVDWIAFAGVVAFCASGFVRPQRVFVKWLERESKRDRG